MRLFAFFSILVLFFMIIFSKKLYAQSTVSDLQEFNTITVALPFLLIVPDSRAGALGDAGVATSPDVYSSLHNPAKLVFLKDKKVGFSFSFSPWLRALVPDMSLSYVNGYYKISETKVVTASLRYFNLGSITFTDNSARVLTDFSPNEFALDASFSQKFGKKFSTGVGFRYMRSNLSGTIGTNGNNNTNPGNSFAADLFAFYKFDKIRLKNGMEMAVNLGGSITNLGAKVSYSQNGQLDFIPANLILGASSTLELDKHNTISLALDFAKLLVPTPPKYALDNFGKKIVDPQTNDFVVTSGISSKNVSAIGGAIQSFYDAPGGFSEEIKEINISTGLEYWYDKKFAVRFGYFYENPQKGSRQFLSAGVGVKFSSLSIDASYLISTSSSLSTNPLANTIRMSLSFEF